MLLASKSTNASRSTCVATNSGNGGDVIGGDGGDVIGGDGSDNVGYRDVIGGGGGGGGSGLIFVVQRCCRSVHFKPYLR
jgi:hypothetical protein